MTTPKQKPKQWKAWGVFTPRGALCDLWVTPPVREQDIPTLNMVGGNKALPIVVTLAKPARRKAP